MMTSPDVIRITGGLSDGTAGHATVAGETMERAPDESAAEFEARAIAAARVAMKAFVVIGGLPLAAREAHRAVVVVVAECARRRALVAPVAPMAGGDSEAMTHFFKDK
jgi:hypothetical protein